MTRAARGTGAYRRSKRPPQAGRADRFGVSLGWGTVAHLEPATPPAVAVPVAEARADGPAQPGAYADETGGREGRPRAWWWTVVTPGGTVFAGRRSRRGQVAQARRGERVGGWGVTERGRGDRWYAPWRRQLCWAHRRRALAAMLARGGRSRASGEAWRGQAHQMFHDWHRVRDGTPAHARFAPDLRPIRREVERLLAAGHTCGVPKTAGTGRDLLKRRQALWTVVRQGGVAPTTHAAERAIRPGVLWRKGRVGTQSPEGSPFVEAMLTVVATLTPPHRQVRDDLTAACEAARRGAAAPALRPTPAALAQRLRPAA